MSKRIFIYDDVRTSKEALKRVKIARTKIDVANPVGDVIHLVRPFRHDGEKIVADHQNAVEAIEGNPHFDIWILDNDLAEGLEGFDFLKLMLEKHPMSAPDKVLSCSANTSRKEKIGELVKVSDVQHLVDVPAATSLDIQRVVRLAKSLGLVMTLIKDVDRVQAFEGRFQVVSKNDPEEVVSDGCHEIAHWLVATPEQRKLPNYGLGSSPDDDYLNLDIPCEMDRDEAQKIESQASLLTVLMQRHMGVSGRNTLVVHNWVWYVIARGDAMMKKEHVVHCGGTDGPIVFDQRQLNEMSEVADQLLARGLIDENFNPIYPKAA